MSVTVVLDGAGLHAWAERRPPRQVLAVMEVLRRAGAGRVLVPAIVTVEAQTVDAVVAEAALRTRAAFLITSDTDDMTTLIDRGTGRTVVVTV